MFKIFYSWQSDLPSHTNHGFIEDALRQACGSAAEEGAIVEPVIDRDTLGLSGAPDVNAAILEKIREADAFVADVSLINALVSPIAEGTLTSLLLGHGRQAFNTLVDLVQYDRPRRLTPNPNVLTELGYALAHLGNEAIIIAVNTHFGEVERLPFDLRSLRKLTYRLSPADRNPSAVKGKFVSDLGSAIRDIAKATKADPVYRIIYPRTLNVVNQAEGVLSELIKASGKPLASPSITKEQLAEVCVQIDANGQAPMIIGGRPGAWQYATWLRFLWDYRQQSSKFTSNVLVLDRFLKKEHVALLASIEQCSYFVQVDAAQRMGIQGNLAWLSESIWEYLSAARRLREYAEKHLARRGRKA